MTHKERMTARREKYHALVPGFTPMFSLRRGRRVSEDDKPQRFRQHADGIGYDVYHPTRGWKRVSAKRVRFQ